MAHLERNNILSDSQHGFRKKRSCETQLLVTIHEISNRLAKGQQVDIILLDFEKAFDKVPHTRLMQKLDFYGVRDSTKLWIQSFLSNRTQMVSVEGCSSSKVEVLSGVPQGTVLGPLLFLLFINDLPEAVKSSSTRLFADDCLLFRVVSNQRDSNDLQKDLHALELWEDSWQMRFNPSKCCVIRVAPSKRKKCFESSYILHGHQLEVVKSEKYLGVHIDDQVSWTKHIESTIGKGNKTLGFLRRNFSDCTERVKAATYTMMVRPALEYACCVWDPYTVAASRAIEQVQRRAARYVFRDYRDRSPGCVTRMLEQLQWESLESRRRSNRLLMLFRIHHQLVDINPHQFINPSQRRTRGVRYQQVAVSHPVLRHSFFIRTVSEWNKLPPSMTSVDSLEALKAEMARGASWQSS